MKRGSVPNTEGEREITGNNNDGDGYVLSIDGELYYIIHWVIHVGNVVIWCENRTLGRRCSFVVVGTHRYRAQNTWLHQMGDQKTTWIHLFWKMKEKNRRQRVQLEGNPYRRWLSRKEHLVALRSSHFKWPLSNDHKAPRIFVSFFLHSHTHTRSYTYEEEDDESGRRRRRLTCRCKVVKAIPPQLEKIFFFFSIVCVRFLPVVSAPVMNARDGSASAPFNTRSFPVTRLSSPYIKEKEEKRHRDPSACRCIASSSSSSCWRRRNIILNTSMIFSSMTAAAYHDSLQRNYINNKTPCVPSALFFFFPFSKEYK